MSLLNRVKLKVILDERNPKGISTRFETSWMIARGRNLLPMSPVQSVTNLAGPDPNDGRLASLLVLKRVEQGGRRRGQDSGKATRFETSSTAGGEERSRGRWVSGCPNRLAIGDRYTAQNEECTQDDARGQRFTGENNPHR